MKYFHLAADSGLLRSGLTGQEHNSRRENEICREKKKETREYYLFYSNHPE